MDSAAERPLICVDLDGVLNIFDFWRGPEYFHPVRPGAREFLRDLQAFGFDIVVFTVRYAPWVEQWLARNDLGEYVREVTDRKPPAHVYLDDRAVCFQGDYARALGEIVAFRPHWETAPGHEHAGLPQQPPA